jgi:Lipopolysaccharide-assembly
MRLPHSRLICAVLLAASLLAQAGCTFYSIRPPYDRNIKTIYVPAFRSISFRKDLNLMLTEKLMKEIQRRTPYVIVNSPEEADAILEGIINNVDKNIVVQSPYNLPRQLNSMLTVEVWYYSNKPGAPAKPPQGTIITENAGFYPELGETSELGYQKAIDKLVAQIVGMMEEQW